MKAEKIKLDLPNIALLIPKFSSGFRLESAPLNLSYLAAMLEKDEYPVKGFNLNFDKLTNSEIKKFNIFGISSPTAVFPEAVKLARRIKKTKLDSYVVIGGPHPTLVLENAFLLRKLTLLLQGRENMLF